jgi:cysteine desulfurase/selenocysteine lyase
LRIYGDPDLDRTPRLGTVAFNVDGLEHGVVAAALNDYFNVAVRNGCFCAHPYVRELLKPELWALDIDPDTAEGATLLKQRQGMVRASLGLYSNAEDLAALLAGLRDLIAHPDYYRAQYRADDDGNFQHRVFGATMESLFDPEAFLNDCFNAQETN